MPSKQLAERSDAPRIRNSSNHTQIPQRKTLAHVYSILTAHRARMRGRLTHSSRLLILAGGAILPGQRSALTAVVYDRKPKPYSRETFTPSRWRQYIERKAACFHTISPSHRECYHIRLEDFSAFQTGPRRHTPPLERCKPASHTFHLSSTYNTIFAGLRSAENEHPAHARPYCSDPCYHAGAGLVATVRTTHLSRSHVAFALLSHILTMVRNHPITSIILEDLCPNWPTPLHRRLPPRASEKSL
ncbi:hypothetical protein C8Q73DRAFT_368335 [Cubamyces lactineus]|nr:hypothetical protein C8Q73DRAFT_368335 [Cubamyces lactineus]